MTKEIEINGNNFSTLNEFYDEIDNKLTKNLGWQTGHNLDAFHDILLGGFGVYEYLEPIKLVWKNSKKSESNLSYDQTIIWIQNKLKHCHPSNIPAIEKELVLAKHGQGQTLYEIILKIIRYHKHISLILE